MLLFVALVSLSAEGHSRVTLCHFLTSLLCDWCFYKPNRYKNFGNYITGLSRIFFQKFI